MAQLRVPYCLHKDNLDRLKRNPPTRLAVNVADPFYIVTAETNLVTLSL
jgi:hypothetical protein